MEIYAKIGTGPGTPIRVKSKRKLPKLKDIIMFKKLPMLRGGDWTQGYIYDIKERGDEQIYFVSLI